MRKLHKVIANARLHAFYRSNAVAFAEDLLGFHPEDRQLPVFDTEANRGILCCSRQWGKSTTIAARALHHATTRPGALIVLCAPTLRQTNELLNKIVAFARSLYLPRRRDGHNRVSLAMPNGSRIVGIPADPDTTRGFSAVSMLLIDEAARVADDVYNALTPFLARSGGALWVMSTPHGRRGFFNQIWSANDQSWRRVFSTVDDCPGIPRDFVERERREKPEADFLEDYYCVFSDSNDQFFSTDDVEAAFRADIPALFESDAHRFGTTRLHYYIGLDLGQRRDHTALAVLELHTLNTGGIDPVTAEWRTQTTLQVRHLELLPLQTPYTDVVGRIRNLVTQGPLRGSSTLVLDATGAGLPVFDFVRRDIGQLPSPRPHIIPVSITSGNVPTVANGLNNVPSRALMSNLQILLQNRALTISTRLPQANTLRTELVEARPGAHCGDLAMAVSLAAWKARLPQALPRAA